MNTNERGDPHTTDVMPGPEELEEWGARTEPSAIAVDDQVVRELEAAKVELGKLRLELTMECALHFAATVYHVGDIQSGRGGSLLLLQRTTGSMEMPMTIVALTELEAAAWHARKGKRVRLKFFVDEVPEPDPDFSGRYCLECCHPLKKADLGKPACPYCGVA